MHASGLPAKPALPLAVACHDAGGANQVIALLKRMHIAATDLRAVMRGPAAALWLRAFPDIPADPELPTALNGAGTLLSGTGWASDVEHEARCVAVSLGVRSIALLDHWVNYPQRFARGNRVQLPDELWVCDPYAAQIAQRDFPTTKIMRIPDCYLEAQCALLAPVDTLAPAHVLFLCEPSLSDWGRDRAGEFQALDYFIDKLPRTGIPDNAAILVRPHPSEPAGKYDGWIAAQTRPRIRLDTGADLSAAMSHARWVIGCQSYAMTVALAAGRDVFSALPPWAPACRLPHPGIHHLKYL